jgi:hypothetical protein
MRKFKSNAVRDTNEGKISYYGFTHPLVEHSFGEYMLRHRTCADGSLREANNWWSGWSTDVSLDSMTRHIKDLEALHAGLFVYKLRDKGEKTIMSIKPIKGLEPVTKEEAINGIKFNCNAYLLQLLKEYSD